MLFKGSETYAHIKPLQVQLQRTTYSSSYMKTMVAGIVFIHFVARCSAMAQHVLGIGGRFTAKSLSHFVHASLPLSLSLSSEGARTEGAIKHSLLSTQFICLGGDSCTPLSWWLGPNVGVQARGEALKQQHNVY